MDSSTSLSLSEVQGLHLGNDVTVDVKCCTAQKTLDLATMTVLKAKSLSARL